MSKNRIIACVLSVLLCINSFSSVIYAEEDVSISNAEVEQIEEENDYISESDSVDKDNIESEPINEDSVQVSSVDVIEGSTDNAEADNGLITPEFFLGKSLYAAEEYRYFRIFSQEKNHYQISITQKYGGTFRASVLSSSESQLSFYLVPEDGTDNAEIFYGSVLTIKKWENEQWNVIISLQNGMNVVNSICVLNYVDIDIDMSSNLSISTNQLLTVKATIYASSSISKDNVEWIVESNGKKEASGTTMTFTKDTNCYQISKGFRFYEKGEYIITIRIKSYYLAEVSKTISIFVSDYESKIYTGEFSFTSNLKEENAKYEYTYDDGWFLESAYLYNHDLSKMSLRVALAAFGNGYSRDASNIKKLLSDLDFENIYSEYPISDSAYEYDSIGFSIGSKTLVDISGKGYTLLCVPIRGGNYGVEWAGDFHLGASGDHEGFLIARDKVYNGIERYIDKYSEQFADMPIKIWITGYSRAAATTNLLAAYLDAGNGLSFKVPIKPENVYAYGFECPQGVNNLFKDNSKCNNIFSIVNPIDFVPKLAMSNLGFSRYGNTLFLPSKSSDYAYVQLKNNMKACYLNFLKYNNIS